ncbi:hypothetical protein ACQPYK_36255 [Streptosporangium sp. CA-135522]|uniref:hypothetical protein n=1 Tax=Streptosporangium sp. CA-135522 TaxID=3240072 RepID=UPI003D8FD631
MIPFLLAAGLLAVAAGVRLSRYDGTPLRVWWAQERMHRRPAHILGRLAKTVLGAACLVGAFAAALILAGVLLAALVAAAAAGLAWYWLRLGARAATPRIYPIERDDLDLTDAGPDATGSIPAVIWPPDAPPPGRDDDPDNPILEV